MQLTSKIHFKKLPFHCYTMTWKRECFPFAQLRQMPPLGRRSRAPDVCAALLKLKTGTRNTPPKFIMLFLIAQQWHISNKQSNLQWQSQAYFIFTKEFTITAIHAASMHKMDPRYRKSLILLLPAEHVQLYRYTVRTSYVHKPFARCSQRAHKISECMHKEISKLTETEPSFST